jgi:transaldolase
MKIFIDTASPDEIRKYSRIGIIDGVTTNPALVAREGKSFKDVVEEICGIVEGPVSAEVISTDVKGMVREALKIADLHENIVVKIPAVAEGFEAVNILSREGVKTNVTILYKANQALLAAKVGATYVSPFIGRLDATSTNGINLIKEIVTIFRMYGFKTQVLAASMRNEIYVKQAALSGADIATVPPDVLAQMMHSELTDLGLHDFLEEWGKLPAEKREYFK